MYEPNFPPARDEGEVTLAAVGTGSVAGFFTRSAVGSTDGPVAGLILDVTRFSTGDGDDDIFDGDQLFDVIDGKKGNDKLSGLGGNDTLIGGAGLDKLTGGGGRDAFLFNAKLAATNVDTVKDFVHDVDVVQLKASIFKKIGPTLDAREFYAKKGADEAHDRNDRIIYDKMSGKLYYDADGDKAGGVDAVHFATLANKPGGVDGGDFLIV